MMKTRLHRFSIDVLPVFGLSLPTTTTPYPDSHTTAWQALLSVTLHMLLSWLDLEDSLYKGGAEKSDQTDEEEKVPATCQFSVQSIVRQRRLHVNWYSSQHFIIQRHFWPQFDHLYSFIADMASEICQKWVCEKPNSGEHDISTF